MPKTEFISRILDRRDKVDREFVEDYLAELAVERDFLQSLFNSMAEGVIALHLDGRTLFANSSAQRLLGFRLGDVVGLNILRYLQHPDLVFLIQEAMEDSESVLDREILIQEPVPRLLNINVLTINSQASEFQGLLVLMEDVTDKRARDDERRRVEKLLSIGHMAAGMAHEIRNPLNSLSLRFQLLKRSLAKKGEKIQESAQEDFDVIEDEIKRLNQVVEHVLSVSASVPKRMEELDPNILVQDFAKVIRPECREANVRLYVRTDKKLTLRVLGDPNSLRQAFLNISKNAIEAMPDGGTLSVGIRVRDDKVCFYFKDTGRGISKDEQSRIFEPYYTTRAKGTGLGLMVVERAVQYHGGSIELDSKPGKGSEFRILLPVHSGSVRMLEMKDRKAPKKSRGRR